MKKFILIVLFFCAFVGIAQKNVSGAVTDSNGEPLAGVNVVVTPNGSSTTTDFDGKYMLTVSEGTYKIKFSSINYVTLSEQIIVGKDKVVKNTTLQSDSKSLDEIVVVGSRIAPRSNTTSALPVDVLSSKDLTSTGQATFDKALQYRIPSFNTVQTPVNDATSLLDPYEIRNMGPSRTLILINGKRKNMSSLVYTQTSPGRGETGADISAIPQDAIERVEILRDGASAQYGSDAIAGVMNIILKKSTKGASATLRA
ncbi:MAG: TonB-dependent receptor plug domain-containing protein, partial [Flavobacterium sp.]|nr:TonB-dependent receptor plug domain-containing protein [Flavobacterium sp.]